MSAMASDENVSKLLDRTADSLFEEYSVEDVGRIIEKMSSDVVTKRADLKYLVGNKYRDLLNVADDIIKMNSLTADENDQLMDLAFKKSNYNTKYLSNLSLFKDKMRQDKTKEVQKNNQSIIFQNAVHDLNYSLIVLKHDVLAELSDSSIDVENLTTINNNNNNSNNFLNYDNIYKEEESDINYSLNSETIMRFLYLAKHIYLIQHFFPDEIKNNPHTFSVIKYKQLKAEFLKLLEKHVKQLRHESDVEFASNLTISYMVASRSSASDSLKWLLTKRGDHVNLLVSSKIKFEDLLNYIYMTYEYLNSLKSRIGIYVNRLKNNSGNQNWIQQTSFKKWIKWISTDKTAVSFTYELSTNDSKIDKSSLELTVKEWEVSISHSMSENFTKRLQNSTDNLFDLVSLLKYILTSFKLYSSLATLSANNSTIVEYMLDQWKTIFADKLSSQLRGLKGICNQIVENFGSESTILTLLSSSKVSKFERYSSDFDIAKFLEASNEKGEDEIFNALDKFWSDLKLTINSVDLLKSTSISLTKSVISVDDYEDEDLWSSIATDLNTFLKKNIELSIQSLTASIKSFIETISSELNRAEKIYKNIQLYYLLKVLAGLEKKINLDEIYETFGKYSIISSKQRIDLAKEMKPLIEQCFRLAVTSTYNEKFAQEFCDLIGQRLATKSAEFPETILWETTSDDKKLPTTPSIQIQTLLAAFSEKILYIEGYDFSKLFNSVFFETVRGDIINLLLDSFKVIFEATEASNEAVLLTYADFLFVSCLKDENLKDIKEQYESWFAEAVPELSTKEYSGQIKQGLVETFRNQSLLYFPLSK